MSKITEYRRGATQFYDELWDIHSIFDEGYYRRNHMTAEEQSMDPVSHFLTKGWRADISPTPLIDPKFYSRLNEKGMKQLTSFFHYFLHGKNENRFTHPLFDPFYYRRNLNLHKVKLKEQENLLAHYIRVGWRFKISPSRFFDLDYYLAQKPRGLKIGEEDPLAHFIEFGSKEGYSPVPFFDTAFYLKNNPKVKTDKPFLHYVTSGAFKYLKAHPDFHPKFVEGAAFRLNRKFDKNAATKTKFVFLHIAKTAGTSFRTCLENQLENPHFLFAYGDPEQVDGNNLLQKNLIEHRNLFSGYFGHFAYGFHELIKSPVIYSTILRDPVDRIISAYLYASRSENTDYHRVVKKGMSLADMIASKRFDGMNNHMTTIIVGNNTDGLDANGFWKNDPKWVQRAFENIENHFNFVGTYENLEWSIKALARLWGFKDVLHVPTFNSNGAQGLEKEKIKLKKDKRLIKIIEEHNQLDRALYQKFARRFHFNRSVTSN